MTSWEYSGVTTGEIRMGQQRARPTPQDALRRGFAMAGFPSRPTVGQPMGYFEIPDDAVTPSEFVAATAAAGHATRKLDLPPVRVSFYVGEGDSRRAAPGGLRFFDQTFVMGFVIPDLLKNRVMIRVGGRAPVHIAHTAAHEVRHLWQRAHGLELVPEEDARSFADRIIAELDLPDYCWEVPS